MKRMLLILTLALLLASTAQAAELTRLDPAGTLYYMDYTGDYYGPEAMEALKQVGFIDPGCSAFVTHNLDGETISCRNYDYPHRISSEDRTLTGLNVVLHCKPEGKYESIALADAVWCDPDSPLLQAGGPDMEGFDPSLLEVLPYECMDGINEKGLFVSIMKLDIKEGDQPANFGVASSMLVRYMLDDCANVEEAKAKVDTAIVTPEDWQDCHVFVTDAEGNRAVIESRNGQVSIIDTDVVTNFYLASDDMADFYRNGELREQAVAMVDEDGELESHYGYGHGYHRYVIISSQLDEYRKDGETMMPEDTALLILRSAAQNPYTTSAGISMTQYSAIYNNARRTLSVWPFQDYTAEYRFDVTGARLQDTSALPDGD